MSENEDFWKVSESKKRELAENSGKKSLTFTYVLAWVLLFGSANLMTLGVGMFILEYVEDSSMSINSYIWSLVIASVLFIYTNSYVVYVKIFPQLSIEKVHKWLVWLGSLTTLAGIGNIGSEITEMGFESSTYTVFILIFWILFLFVFKKFENFK
tara:strand:+ start:382 stop:846 length:465 start_codon:yes stop_codon:yes gene_type:complete